MGETEKETSLLEFTELKEKFENLTGKGLSQGMEMTQEGTLEMFKKAVDLEERLISGKVKKGDEGIAAYCADKALNWYSSCQRAVVHGDMPSLKDPQLTQQILEEMKTTVEPGERKNLIAQLYLHDPNLGANRTVGVLEKLSKATF